MTEKIFFAIFFLKSIAAAQGTAICPFKKLFKKVIKIIQKKLFKKIIQLLFKKNCLKNYSKGMKYFKVTHLSKAGREQVVILDAKVFA